MSSAAMENFVMNVQTLSSQGNFSDLNEFLQKNMEILVRNPAHLSNVLETLDVQQHSLGVLAVRSINYNNFELLNFMQIFLYFPSNSLGRFGNVTAKSNQ